MDTINRYVTRCNELAHNATKVLMQPLCSEDYAQALGAIMDIKESVAEYIKHGMISSCDFYLLHENIRPHI